MGVLKFHLVTRQFCLFFVFVFILIGLTVNLHAMSDSTNNFNKSDCPNS